MKNFYKISLNIFIFITLSFTTYAGNLGNLKLNYSGEYKYEEENELVIEGENLNTSFSVTGIVANYRIISKSDETEVYSENKDVDEVLPGSDFVVNFGALPWGSLEVGSSYYAEIEFTADFDEDESNNLISWEFTVGSNYISREDAMSIALEYINLNYEINSNYIAYMMPEMSKKGDMLANDFYQTNLLELTSPAWVCYFDMYKTSLFSHPFNIISIDAVSGEIEEKSGDYMPYVNSEPISTVFSLPENIILGDAVIPSEEPEYIYEISNDTIKTKETCVFLVSGVMEDGWDSLIFINSKKIIKKELQKEKKGLQIPDANFKDFTNPTAEELSIGLNKFKDSCDKIIFYYNGHASKSGVPKLKGKDELYWDSILETLIDMNSTEICIIIDACYSGVMIEKFKEGIEDELYDLNGKKITIITSSDATKPSEAKKTQRDEDGKKISSGFGVFTGEFAESYGSDSTDVNKDGKTTLGEAFDDIRKKNREINKETKKKMNDQNPQKYEFEDKKFGEDKNVSFGEGDLKLSINSGFDNQEGISYSMEISNNIVGEVQNFNIFEASSNRLINISSDAPNGSFNAELTFALSPIYNIFTGSEGEIGVIYRENSTGSWTVYPKTMVDEVANSVSAMDVSSFSQWAIARVKKVKSVRNLDELGVIINAYPNPFNNEFSINFESEKLINLDIEIVDLTGRKVENIVNFQVVKGGNNLTFDMKNLHRGYYLLKISYNEYSELIQLIKMD